MASGEASLSAYLLGPVAFSSIVALQQRLVYELSAVDHARRTLFVCDHPPRVTIGRQGSRGDVLVDAEELEQRQIDVQYVGRGGGAILHLSGQLALYPILSLAEAGWSVGAYLDRLEAGLLRALAELRIAATTRPGRRGVWGRTGLLAAIGVAVRNDVAYFGAYLNVEPRLGLMRRVATDAAGRLPMSSLLAERQGAIRMASVREAVVRAWAESFECPRLHLFSRHPLLERQTIPVDEAFQPRRVPRAG